MIDKYQAKFWTDDIKYWVDSANDWTKRAKEVEKCP